MAKESKSEERKSPPSPHGFKDKKEQAEYIKKQKKGEPEVPLYPEGETEREPQEAVKKIAEEIPKTETEDEPVFDVEEEIKKSEETKKKVSKR